MRRCLAVALGAVLAFGMFTSVDTHAAGAHTLYVSQTGLDSGICKKADPCATVTYALTKAPSGATIEISGTIDDHVGISSPVTLTNWPGGPAHSAAALDSVGSDSDVVDVNAKGVTIKDLTIEGSDRSGIGNDGTLTLTDSTVSGNTIGIENGFGAGPMTIVNSTIAKNKSNDGSVAGIDNGGNMTIIASTVSENSGGGIYSDYAPITLGATIVAGNSGGNCGAQGPGLLYSIGYNLTDDKNGAVCSFTAATDLVNKNPHLGPLANNGGPTETMLPARTSPGANVIPRSTTLRGVKVCPGTDQRGVSRPGAGETRCTVGAVEAGGVTTAKPTKTSVTVIPSKVIAGTRVVYLVVVTSRSGTGMPKGKISFKIGSRSLCKAVLSGGVAACGATTAPLGSDTVKGTYSGGGGYAASSGTATLTVTKA